MTFEREDYADVGTIDREDEVVLPVLPAFPAPIAPAARQGFVGDFLRLVEPHTESDPAALLIQWLVAFGSVIGRSAFFVADGSDHHTNLSAVLVAPTSKGRKGTAWAHVKRFWTGVDPTYHPVSGLASGEGLVYHVRDPLFVREEVKDKGRGTGIFQDVLQDGGVEDKRLMVVEPEFARLLKACGREGSTLSAIVRDAWDNGSLANLTKNSPLTATNAHVAIIGHITADELRRSLTSTEAANGFGNRFLWVCAQRSKYLPDGGAPDHEALAQLMHEVKRVVTHAGTCREMQRSTKARDLWHAEYRQLSDGPPGLFGSMTGRAEAQVVRLSLLYALLDGTRGIDLRHLEAALAVWRYCRDSAAYVFGDSLGNPMSDDLRVALTAAGGAGLSRTEMNHTIFGRNRSRAEIQRAVQLLQQAGLAHGAYDYSAVGRPVERWYATTE